MLNCYPNDKRPILKKSYFHGRCYFQTLLLSLALLALSPQVLLAAHFEYYFQSILAPQENPSQVLLSENRIRIFLDDLTLFSGAIKPYFGLYSNPYFYGPSVGLKSKLYDPLNLWFFAENRWLFGLSQVGQPQDRLGFWGGGFKSFSISQTHQLELDHYYDLILISQIDNSPISTGWLRLTYPLFHSIYGLSFGPMAQLWGQASPSAQLGPETYQVRPGALVKLWAPHIGFNFLAYQKIDIKNSLNNMGPEFSFFIEGSFE